MENFELKFGGVCMQNFVLRMAAKDVAGPGTPGGIIEYVDYSDQKDNSSYVSDLVKGVFQPVEVFNGHNFFLSQIDLEKLVQEAENSTKDIDPGMQNQPQPQSAVVPSQCFGALTNL